MILAALIAVMLLAQGSPIVQPPPVPAPNITVRNELVVPEPDPKLIADASVQSSEAILLNVIAPPPLAWANDLLGFSNVWTRTPDELTWNNPAVRDLANILLAVAFAMIALAIFANGAGHALGQDVSFGRLIFAAVLAVGNLGLWEMGIKLNNAICASLSAPDLPTMIRANLVAKLDPGTAAGTVILTLVYAIVALLLLFNLLFRLGLIDILIAVGSLALLCYATPHTEHLASHYTRLSVGILFSQVLIVLGLRVASVLGSLGNGGVVGTILSIVVLILVRSLPQTMIAGAGAGGRQGNGLGMAALMIIRRRVGL